MHRLLLLLVATACGAAPEAQPAPGTAGAAGSSAALPAVAAAVDSVALPDSVRRPPQPLVPTPNAVRGLYVNRWAAIGQKMWQLIEVAKTTEVNALVLDVKDDRGFVLYRSTVPLAREIGADTNRPMSYRRMRAVLDTMRAHGIYPIARIVVAKDPLLAEHRRAWAIRRRDDPAQPWLDKNGNPWLDPHQDGVWDYAVELAREAVNLGFSEVQLDYVRFPDEKRLVREASFPLANGRVRAVVIRDQLERTRTALKPLGVPFAADVFGLTTTDTTDMGIGQRWEEFVDRMDVVLPMTYPSHYAPGTYGIGRPNAKPHAVIDRAMRDARARSLTIPGAARIVPWYQDFTLGAPRYGAAQVRAQIEAGYEHGIMSWMLWNPGSRYTVAALRPEGSDLAARTPKPVEPWRRGDADTTRVPAAR
ncbi:MAG TPA: putative glycoside hydrolase [Gemmatimonadaceae bacterium]|nr:putative glycoside hydrolase [Gemmatimonadaceae bacterium]